MSLEIIDFHTHPFRYEKNNICQNKDYCHMSAEDTRAVFVELGICRIAGSVVMGAQSEGETLFDKVRRNNDEALALRALYGDFYIPGFHIHPDFVEESIAEIHRMHAAGVCLMGEVVPYIDGWTTDYASENLSVILDEAERLGMVFSLHTMNDDALDALVKRHKHLTVVAAHPGEHPQLMRHLARARLSENYCLDISGTGVFRYGALRRAVSEMGADRVLFGSDFPTCHPGMFLGAVVNDRLLTDTEKEKILSHNAKRILGLRALSHVKNTQ